MAKKPSVATGTPSRARRLDRYTRVVLICVGVALVIIGLLNLLARLGARDEPEPTHWVGLSEGQPPTVTARNEAPPPLTFDGSSSALTQTKILPVLASPLDKNHSVVWCGTLGLAWKKFASELKQGRITLSGAEELCELLHQEPAVELSPEHYYVNAGWRQDGILERMRTELAAKFPNAPSPPAPEGPPTSHDGLAYAYLEVVFRYQFEFKQNHKPLEFIDGAGKKTAVKSFGIRAEDHGLSGYRGQVRVLFRDKNEFAVDLCNASQPYQIVLARIPPRATLAASLEELDRRVSSASPYSLGNNTVLLMPVCSWRIQHRFKELGWKAFVPSKVPDEGMSEVAQTIDFRMDHKGVVLKSVARSYSTILNGDGEVVNPDLFLFDRPYFIVLKKRGGRPFFAFWVANAELLTPY